MSNQLPVTSGNLAAFPKQGAAEVTYPFEGDTGHYVIRQKYRGLIANYAAPNISGATHDVFTVAYCVGDRGINDVGGGVVEVQREFSTIPNSRTEAEFYPFGFPALGEATIGNILTVSNVVGSDSNSNLTITTSTNHGWTNTNFIRFNWLLVSTPGGGIGITQNGDWSGFPLTTTSNTIKVQNRTPYPYGTPVVFEVVGLREHSVSREARTIVAPSYVSYDYYMPGVSTNINTTADIPLIQESRWIVSNSGAEADTINANTVPNIAQWRSRASAGEYFVATPSILRRYKGNIWERSTRYVKYV